jgi:hypothetical protein
MVVNQYAARSRAAVNVCRRPQQSKCDKRGKVHRELAQEASAICGSLTTFRRKITWPWRRV